MMSRLFRFRLVKSKTFPKYLRCIHHGNGLNSSNQYEKPNLKSLLDNAATFKEKNPSDDEWKTPVYPNRRRLQSEKSFRPSVDPTTTSVILFPGQGSQYVGMAKSLLMFPNVKEMFESASEILRYDLLDLCLNGPEDMLNMTVHSQVAVMVASLAAVEKLNHEAQKIIENCVAAAGFSVGEYSALVFAGALKFEHAVKLLKIRGEAMQAASDLEPSGMMTVFLEHGAKIKEACLHARQWCDRQMIPNADCRVGVYLFPDCKVVSGHMEALKFLESNAVKFKIKKIKYLPVSGAFHSKLMKPAQKVFETALNKTPFVVPLIPVHANVGGTPHVSVDGIRKKLAEQLCSPVEWEQTMHIIFERSKGTEYPYVFECGPGTSMKTALRFNNNLAYQRCASVLA